jgi:hypothetical protein
MIGLWKGSVANCCEKEKERLGCADFLSTCATNRSVRTNWLSWFSLYAAWMVDISSFQQTGYHDCRAHYWNTSLNIAVWEIRSVFPNGVAFSVINHSTLMNIHYLVNNCSRQVTCTNFGFFEQGCSEPLITRHELLIFLLTKIRINRTDKILQKAH